ncbi:hypothetical protein B5P44_00205 [Mycobacterium sp. CBMA 213]|uniref:Uncharacterized protein n=1 Tax=Mycolicibacterium sp. CBMA 213 TaxID=1968788 RepID=A0A343VR18_9MYCO|nr:MULTISPECIES: hypothetical protein [unclassified Mycolicibacterium]AVN58342.1 hypothetical protein B5P44_p00047 [Mycolicibacterium sp. CBMA 213]MUL61007.1 hypothetical protein [Mycolicibacterium sp. CBMA 335]MUM03244.1 hypothetical protein [Mycolicibacterium sp. CBMA 213]
MKWAQLADEPTAPKRGFADCFNDLVERRTAELASKWDNTPERSRRAQAKHRARVEMLRRIKTRSGRQYKESTIEKWAAHNTWPPGIDTFWFERWAVIDRAGGIDALANSLRCSRGRIVAWRDSPDPNAQLPKQKPPPGAPKERRFRIGVETLGILRIGETGQHHKRIPTDPNKEYEVLVFDPDSTILDAWYAEDLETVMDLLSDAITEQVISTWDVALYYDYSYTVTEILKFLIL